MNTAVIALLGCVASKSNYNYPSQYQAAQQLSTWYSSSLYSDGYGTNTSYDYVYGNSYSYISTYGDVAKWDYSTWGWNTTGSSYTPVSYTSTWYSTYLESDGPGTNTSYDSVYDNSYSYNTYYGDVSKWDYGTGDWNTSSSTDSTSYDSTWYSTYLESDGYGTNTSYDYSYGNSYSYITTYGDVARWDYSTGDWNTSSPASTDNYYDGQDSTWYSPSLYSDGSSTQTSYDYSYGNSYSYETGYGDVDKWDYRTDNWNDTQSSYYTGHDSSWYSSSLYSDGYGTHTSYDYVYGNSYSYVSSSGDVLKWDYRLSDWNDTTDASTDSTYYTGMDSTWYSSTLSSDGYGSTSYDWTYGNSYSYVSSTGDVAKWDYKNWAWNTTQSSYYTGMDSTWYSPSLYSDGYGYRSYDYTYGNSYSYISTYGDVAKWDYRLSDWNTTGSSYYYLNLASTGLVKPDGTSTNVLLAGLGLASASVVGIVGMKLRAK